MDNKNIERIKEKYAGKAPILEIVVSVCELRIDATDGIVDEKMAEGVFKGGLDPDFICWGREKHVSSTINTVVNLYKLVRPGSFSKIFGSFDVSLDKLCLTKPQIVNFCKKHINLMEEENQYTLFLYKDDYQFFVAHADTYPEGIKVISDPFTIGRNWQTNCPVYVVIPKQK